MGAYKQMAIAQMEAQGYESIQQMNLEQAEDKFFEDQKPDEEYDNWFKNQNKESTLKVQPASPQAKPETISQAKPAFVHKAPKGPLELTAIQVGVVESINVVPQKFGGFGWRINIEGQKAIYLNSKEDGAADRLFKVGQKAAFATHTKKTKHGTEYKIVDSVFLTF